MIARLYRAACRAWLELNITAWDQDLAGIAKQRDNDREAERAITERIIRAKAHLRSLTNHGKSA